MEMKKKNGSAARNINFISVAGENPPFAYVEAYKSLRTNIGYLTNVNKTEGASSILVTSAVPEESKSTTAINLSLTLAAGGKKVVLVECDLRKPVLRKYLKRELNKNGLSAYLANKANLDSCITDLPDLGISVIGAGAIPPNPSELLNSWRMKEMMDILKDNFDYVILDAPPVTVVTDAIIVGRLTDGAILVVRSKFASARTIRKAKEKLENVGVHIFGAVLTRFDIKKSGWRGGYEYQYYEYGYGQGKGKR